MPKDNYYLLETEENVTEWLRKYSNDSDETYVRSFLGRMLFSGDEALKEVKNSKIERITDNVLKELNIDTKYSKTVLKLADFADIQDISNETLKPIIEKTINEELPMLINEEKTKIGVDKPEDKKIVSGAKDYLDKKYANNPYYNK